MSIQSPIFFIILNILLLVMQYVIELRQLLIIFIVKNFVHVFIFSVQKPMFHPVYILKVHRQSQLHHRQMITASSSVPSSWTIKIWYINNANAVFISSNAGTALRCTTTKYSTAFSINNRCNKWNGI